MDNCNGSSFDLSKRASNIESEWEERNRNEENSFIPFLLDTQAQTWHSKNATIHGSKKKINLPRLHEHQRKSIHAKQCTILKMKKRDETHTMEWKKLFYLTPLNWNTLNQLFCIIVCIAISLNKHNSRHARERKKSPGNEKKKIKTDSHSHFTDHLHLINRMYWICSGYPDSSKKKNSSCLWSRFFLVQFVMIEWSFKIKKNRINSSVLQRSSFYSRVICLD